MHLFHSPTSPYVRKVDAAAIELALSDRIQRISSSPHPVRRDAVLIEKNPVGKVPALVLADGEVLYESSVICEYLDSLAGGHRLFPESGPARWRALQDQALGDGILDAALLVRYEMARPAPVQWSEWTEGQTEKIRACLKHLEQRVDGLTGRFDIGSLTLACALGYLDFRFAHLDWRKTHSRTARWYDAVKGRECLSRTQPG